MIQVYPNLLLIRLFFKERIRYCSLVRSWSHLLHMISNTDHSNRHGQSRGAPTMSSSSPSSTKSKAKAQTPSDRSRWWNDVMSVETPPIKPIPMNKSSSGVSGQRELKPRATRQFPCPNCPDKNFERRGHLDAHIETVHEGKRPHSCPRGCGKVFGHRSSLQRHVKTVHENPDHPDYHKTRSRNYASPSVNMAASPPPK